MSETTTHAKGLNRGEIIVALIGLGGILVTAVFSNWDKLFPKDQVVQASYSGYRPTGDFETELRYYYDVSGARRSIDEMQRQLLLSARNDLLEKYPNEAGEIKKVFDAVEKEQLRVDDIIRAMMPAFQKHFTVAELQELNKFYSTDVMQGLAKKTPFLMQELAPVQVKLMNDFQERFYARLSAAMKDSVTRDR